MSTVQRPTVYDGGFQAANVDRGEYPDLMGHLFTEFLKHLEAQRVQGKGVPTTVPPSPVLTKKAMDTHLMFLEFARKHLDANPPRSQRYVGSGIALELQSGTIVTFNTQDATVVDHREAAVGVATPRSQPGQHGISDTSAISITTGRNKVQTDARTQADPQVQAPGSPKAGRRPGGRRPKPGG